MNKLQQQKSFVCCYNCVSIRISFGIARSVSAMIFFFFIIVLGDVAISATFLSVEQVSAKRTHCSFPSYSNLLMYIILNKINTMQTKTYQLAMTKDYRHSDFNTCSFHQCYYYWQIQKICKTSRHNYLCSNVF